MAIVMATRIVAPNFWGYVADRTGKRLLLVRFGALMVTLCWLGVFLARDFWPLAGVLLAYGFFQNAILAQFEAITIAHLGDRRERYSQIRLWGSLGFIVTGTGLGIFFDHFPVTALPLCLLACTLATWLASLLVPDIRTPVRAESAQGFLEILQQRPVWAFFVAHFLLQLSHAPYYTFYSIYLETHGYTRSQIGWLWGIGVFAEVLVFACMAKLLPWVGETRLLFISLGLSALRWLMIGFLVDEPALIVAAQLLHAASFASFHAAAMTRIYRYFGDGHQGQGQAIYSMLWGVGVALGSWAAGMIWNRTTAPWIYASASVLCVLALLVLRGSDVKTQATLPA